MGGGLYQVIMLGSVLVFLATLALYLRSGRASLFHPVTIYLAFHFVVFVFRPLLVFYRGYDLIYLGFDFQPTFTDKSVTLLGANLGLLVFVAACMHFGSAWPRLTTFPDRQLGAYVKPVALTCVLLGIPGLWSLYTVLGMTSLGTVDNQWQMDAATGITINTTSNGYLLDAQLMLATLTGMFAYVHRFRIWALLPFIIFVVLRAGTGGRGPFISATVFIVLLYLFHRRRRWLNATTVVLGGFMLTLFRLVGDYRSVGFQQLFANDSRVEGPRQTRFLESMDWANLEFYEFVVYAVPQRTKTYDYFASLLQLFTEPIPRVLWPDKPIGAPIKMFNLLDYGRPYGATLSLPGSGWYELGWAGIVILCAAFAWLYGRAYNRFMRAEQTPFAVMLYCAFMMSAVVAFRDGLIITVARQSLFYLAPVVVMEMLARAYGAGRRASSGAIPAPMPHRPAAEVPISASTPRERRRSMAARLDGL